MLISVHVQKTAGTAFRTFAQRNLGERMGLSYAVSDLDDPALARAVRELKAGDPGAARRAVAESGVRLIHGHKVKPFLELCPDAPAMIWLRDPLSRLISEFLHLRRAQNPGDDFAAGIRDGEHAFTDLVAKRNRFYADHLAALRAGGRPTLIFLSECADEAEGVFRDVLDWRGGLGRVNAAPQQDEDAARSLESEHAALRNTALAEESALFEDIVATWRSGDAQAAARDALRSGGLQRISSIAAVARSELTRIKDLVRRLRA